MEMFSGVKVFNIELIVLFTRGGADDIVRLVYVLKVRLERG